MRLRMTITTGLTLGDETFCGEINRMSHQSQVTDSAPDCGVLTDTSVIGEPIRLAFVEERKPNLFQTGERSRTICIGRNGSDRFRRIEAQWLPCRAGAFRREVVFVAPDGSEEVLRLRRGQRGYLGSSCTLPP